MIHANQISFSYPALQPGSEPHKVFSKLTLALEEGHSLAVMGVNGAGKSTLGYILAGLAPKYTGGTLTGDLRVAGINPLIQRPATGSIGLLFQDPAPQLFNTTVAYEVAWGLEAMGLPPHEITIRVQEAMERFGMTAHAHHPPWALSGGEQKRCALASVWAMHPELLILDEPLNGLDIKGRQNLLSAMDILQHSGTTILAMTHQPHTAQLAENVIFLENGTATSPQPPTYALQQKDYLVNAGLAYPPELWPDLQSPAQEISNQPAIDIHHLHYQYPDGRPALQDINLSIPRGQFVAIIGHNGAGKSTLARHLNGLLHPTQGDIHIMGKSTAACPTGELAREVGFLFQRPEQQLFAPTVREEIAFGVRNLKVLNPENAINQVLASFNLTDVADYAPTILSYGTQRAVTLASLAAMQSPIMVLDEPTVGLDGRGWKQLLAWLAELRARGTTLIVITHEMSLASRADRVLLLDAGTVIADGPPDAVLSQAMQGA